MPYKEKWKKRPTYSDYKRYLEIRKKYRGVLQYFTRMKSTDFWNKYYKNRAKWDNKLAYLSGLIDGEGYLKIEKWGTIRLIIGMTDRKTIYWIKNQFGGKVYKESCRSGKPIYYWKLNQGEDLLHLLVMTLPFLQAKKKKLAQGLRKLITKLEKLDFLLKGRR